MLYYIFLIILTANFHVLYSMLIYFLSIIFIELGGLCIFVCFYRLMFDNIQILYMQSAQHIKSTSKDNTQPSSQDLNEDYMGKDSKFIWRNLSFHYFKVLRGYKKYFKNKKLINYRPQYEQMVRSNYMWEKFRNLGAEFNIFKEVFLAERGPFLLVILIALLIGVLALFGAYYQRFLFTQFLQEDFQTSSWIFFTIIAGSAVLRFFLFNYAQNLANEVSTNVRCYLDNALVRLVLHIPDDISDGLLINNFFVSSQIVQNAIRFTPYFVASVVIVFGIVGFIIGIVGHIGWVVLGLTIFFIIIELFILRWMLHLHHDYVYVSDKRTSLLLLGTQMLLKLTYNGLSKIYLSLMKKYRKQQTEIDRKYNLGDGLIQVMTESISFISIFIFYIVAENNLRNNGAEDPTYKEIFQVVVLFSVFKTPIKMVGYGLSIALEGYAGMHRLAHLFEKCGYVPPSKQDQTFKRIYPNPSLCFQSELHVPGCQEQPAQIHLAGHNILEDHKGQLVMIVGKIDAHPNCDQYLTQIESHLKNKGYCKIGYANLIQDKTIKQNILFGQQYDEDKYNEVLQIVNLKDKINRFPEGENTRMDENYFKTIYLGLAFKIEMARAIYSQVQTILINRMIFKEYQEIIGKIKNYGKKKGHTTIVVNLSGSHYKLADWIVVLGKNGEQQGTYDEMIKSSEILQQFETEYLTHIDLISDDKTSKIELSKLQQQKVDYIQASYKDYFRFYNLSHFGAGFILLILLALPPLMDLYMEVIIAESAHGGDHSQQQTHSPLVSEDTHTTTDQQLQFDHVITTRYGVAALLFIILNLTKIIVFTIYLKISGYKIVRNVIQSFLNSKIQNTLSASNRKNALNLERNVESLDTRITADLDVGITIIFQQLTALIFGAVSSALFLAIGVPFFIVTIIIIATMVFYNRSILYIRRQARSKFNSFVKKLILHRKTYKAYHRDDYITKQFIDQNKYDIKADLNTEWLLQSLGILLEIVFILLLIVTMAVSIVKFEQLNQTNQAFLQLAISFLIGLTNGARINLKIFQSMDMQIIGITSIFKIISLHKSNKSEQTRPFPDYRLFTIQYRNFSIRFKDDIIHNLNLKIKAGERIVITGSRRGGKRVAFYSLLGIFEPEHLYGDIYLNRLPIYTEKITRGSLSGLIYILQNQNLTFSGETVEEAIKIRAPRRQTYEIDYALKQMWRVLQIRPLFDSSTPLRNLSQPSFDLFSLIRAIMVRPQMLVIQGGMSHIDSLNRKKLTKWLIDNNEISILVDLTNRIQVIREYPRLLEFREGRLVKDEIQYYQSLDDKGRSRVYKDQEMHL